MGVRFFNSAALKTLLWDNNLIHMVVWAGAYLAELNNYALEQKLAEGGIGGVPLSRINVGREFSYESAGLLPVGWWHLLPAVGAFAKLVDVIKKKHALGNELVFQEIISNKMDPKAFQDYYRGHKDPLFSRVFPGRDYGKEFASLMKTNQEIQRLESETLALKGEIEHPRTEERKRAATGQLLITERLRKLHVDQAEGTKGRIERSLLEESNKTDLISDVIEMFFSFVVVSNFANVLSKFNSLAELPTEWDRDVLSGAETVQERFVLYSNAPYVATKIPQPAGQIEALRRLYEARTEQFGGFSSFNVTLDRSYGFRDVSETVSLLPYATDYWGINYAVPTVSAFAFIWALKNELKSAFDKWSEFFDNQVEFREEWLRKRELGNLLLRLQSLSTEYGVSTFTEEDERRLDEIVSVLGKRNIENK